VSTVPLEEKPAAKMNGGVIDDFGFLVGEEFFVAAVRGYERLGWLGGEFQGTKGTERTSRDASHLLSFVSLWSFESFWSFAQLA
jgi:hypothetical protein